MIQMHQRQVRSGATRPSQRPRHSHAIEPHRISRSRRSRIRSSRDMEDRRISAAHRTREGHGEGPVRRAARDSRTAPSGPARGACFARCDPSTADRTPARSSGGIPGRGFPALPPPDTRNVPRRSRGSVARGAGRSPRRGTTSAGTAAAHLLPGPASQAINPFA